MTLEALQNLIQAEARIEPQAQHIYHNGQLIADKNKTMSDLGIADHDMLALHVRDLHPQIEPGTRGPPQPARPVQQDPELIRLQILGNAQLRAELQRQQPEMANALEDPQRFAQMFNASFDRDRRERLERQQAIERLNEDPFDVEAQARIEEMIRQERVMENLQNAMEHNPEGI
jgi:DNA damage-inducible protein 1